MSFQWDRFNRYFLRYPGLHFSLDISRVYFEKEYFETMSAAAEKAFKSMEALEKGAIANSDEKRMVGHYWLRAPELAPNEEVRCEIEDTNDAIYEFIRKVDAAELQAANGEDFTDLLLIGIGGSALGPQFVADALGNDSDRMRVHYLDKYRSGTDRSSIPAARYEHRHHVGGRRVEVRGNKRNSQRHV